MFALVSLLLLTATPSTEQQVHAPPPSKTPAELRALCGEFDIYPPPNGSLLRCPDDEFNAYFKGTFEAYFQSSGAERQEWLDAFPLMMDRLREPGKSMTPVARLATARILLAKEIVSAFDSDPPRSRHRTAKTLTTWSRSQGEIVGIGLPVILEELQNANVDRALWAAHVLYLLARDPSDAPDQIELTKEIEPDFNYSFLPEQAAPRVALALQNTPNVQELLHTLAFRECSREALWLIALLPPDIAYAALEDELHNPQSEYQAYDVMQVLHHADKERLSILLKDVDMNILGLIASQVIPLTHIGKTTKEFFARIAEVDNAGLCDWVSHMLHADEIPIAYRQQLALWSLDQNTDLLAVIAELITDPDSHPGLKPYAAVAFCKIDPKSGIQYVRDCVKFLPEPPRNESWYEDYSDVLGTCLAKYGTKDDMILLEERRRGPFAPRSSFGNESAYWLARNARSEPAILAYVQQLREQTTLTKQDINQVCRLHHDLRWPSPDSKDVYFAFIKELLKKPESRYEATKALLDGQGYKSYPAIVAEIDKYTELERSWVIAEIARSYSNEADECLVLIRNKTTDAKARLQISHILDEKPARSALRPKTELGMQVLPSYSQKNDPVFHWWQIVATVSVCGFAALYLRRLAQGRKR